MRAAVVTAPDALPVCADLPEPMVPPGSEPLHLVGAGLDNNVRGLATWRHYGRGQMRYPPVRATGLHRIRAPALRDDGRAAGRSLPGGGSGGGGSTRDRRGMNPGLSGWMVLTARRKEVGALSTVLVLGATGVSGGLAVQGALALGAERVIAAGRDPEALERLRGAGATTVSPAHYGPDGLEQALADAVSETSPDLVPDHLWGPVTEAAFAALGRSGEDTEANTAYV